jgi:hypothetical protein
MPGAKTPQAFYSLRQPGASSVFSQKILSLSNED